MKGNITEGDQQPLVGSESMYRQIIEYSIETIVIHRDHHVVYINDAGADFLRAQKKNILGACVLDLFDPAVKPSIVERIRQGMEEKEPAEVIEHVITRLDGSKVEVELYCHPVMFGNSKAIQTVFRDLTERKKAEKRLNDQEKLASIGQIAAGIAHEVRNPLTSVKGFLQLLKESHSHPYLSTMESELDKAIATLQNLLQVSKPDLQEEPYVNIDCCKELKALLLLFEDRLYQVDVIMDLRHEGILLLGKKNLFLKAFFNLIKNALEAMDNKGTLTIQHYYEKEKIQIKISDTGIGIPKDKLNMLGTPFFSSKSEGTGLGLTQVFTTVNDHGGNICVESEWGKGTTFHIQLPVQKNKLSAK